MFSWRRKDRPLSPECTKNLYNYHNFNFWLYYLVDTVIVYELCKSIFIGRRNSLLVSPSDSRFICPHIEDIREKKTWHHLLIIIYHDVCFFLILTIIEWK